MLLIIAETIAPITSLFIFILGTGFFSTLLALSMTAHDATPIAIGAMTGIYYAGLVSGSFRIEPFIARIGHIRAYSVFSAALAIVCLLHGLFYNVWLWLALRFIAGFASAGLFVVIESWLLCKSAPENRGQILSLYMISFFAAQSIGQFFLNLSSPQVMLQFAIASMLCSLSIIPLSMTHVRSPQFDEPSTLSLKKILQESTSGFVGCFCAGLIMGVLYGLMPVYLEDIYHHRTNVATYMFAIIMGGMVLQYPVGKLSDIFERRLVLIGLSVLTIAISLILFIAPMPQSIFFFIQMVLLGGITFTFYPVSISHACESLKPNDMVAGTQTLLLSYSIGAMLGPFIAPLFMHIIGDRGIFIYIICVLIPVIPLFVVRRAQRKVVTREENFLSIPQTSPILFELDPRSEE